jgi:hypothetical protein
MLAASTATYVQVTTSLVGPRSDHGDSCAAGAEPCDGAVGGEDV